MQVHNSRQPVRGRPGLFSHMKQGKKCYGFVVDGERVNGKRRQITRQGFTSIAAAEKARTALLHRKHTGDVVEPSRELLSDFFERWLSGKALSVRETTLIDYRRTFTRLLSALGDRPIGAIRGDHIQGMVTALVAKGYAARTVREAVNLLRLVFRSAVEWRLVDARAHRPMVRTGRKLSGRMVPIRPAGGLCCPR